MATHMAMAIPMVMVMVLQNLPLYITFVITKRIVTPTFSKYANLHALFQIVFYIFKYCAGFQDIFNGWNSAESPKGVN